MITHILLIHIGSQVKRRQSQSYNFKEFAKISQSGHGSVNRRTDGQTDGQIDGRTGKAKPGYPHFNFVEAGCIINGQGYTNIYLTNFWLKHFVSGNLQDIYKQLKTQNHCSHSHPDDLDFFPVNCIRLHNIGQLCQYTDFFFYQMAWRIESKQSGFQAKILTSHAEQRSVDTTYKMACSNKHTEKCQTNATMSNNKYGRIITELTSNSTQWV